MYDSEDSSPKVMSEIGNNQICRMPAGQFHIRFTPSNDYEKGMGVAIIVDGILCTSKEAALSLFTKRLDDLHKQWLTHVEKG